MPNKTINSVQENRLREIVNEFFARAYENVRNGDDVQTSVENVAEDIIANMEKWNANEYCLTLDTIYKLKEFLRFAKDFENKNK